MDVYRLAWHSSLVKPEGNAGSFLSWLSLQSRVDNPDGSFGIVVSWFALQLISLRLDGNAGSVVSWLPLHESIFRLGYLFSFVSTLIWYLIFSNVYILGYSSKRCKITWRIVLRSRMG